MLLAVVAYPAGTVSRKKAVSIADNPCGRSSVGKCPAQGRSTGRAPGSSAASLAAIIAGLDQLPFPQVGRSTTTRRAGRRGQAESQAREARGAPPDSGAAAHPANHFIAGKAVLQHPWHELIDINRIRQVPRRLVS